jgi:hypothetical protein
MAQVVECLLSKHEALSSNPNSAPKTERKRQKKRERERAVCNSQGLRKEHDSDPRKE